MQPASPPQGPANPDNGLAQHRTVQPQYVQPQYGSPQNAPAQQ